MNHTRLALGAAVALALTLSACSSDDGGSAAKPTAKASGSHTVDTAMGGVKVKNLPERVVVLNTAGLDSAITLGVRPVGATRAGTDQPFLSYLPAAKTKGIAEVGERESPDLKKIAGLKPDLIIGDKAHDGRRYKQLGAIAPTVLTGSADAAWKRNFLVHADALGEKARAKQVAATYRKHVAAVTKAVGGAGAAARTEVNVLRFVAGSDIRISGRRTPAGRVLSDVGLGRPAITRQARGGLSYDVGPEEIGRADADAIFTSTYGNPGLAKVAEATTSGQWRGIRAVRDSRVYNVADELWAQGVGYTAAGQILSELESDLAVR
ncbi:iron-siderophore ABC transporter substrate-binding protein [Streptomyces endophyticus]|uniref:Iron-siderophore ABC transporter substrate-binding protein n=1 Tax=Streptomyces endophyticus TaxID=714166 RepID=A0ABU6FAK2_9ACTN|nr:iron-siderophore ABC transporter substrate-binding protein [Streptomyces endophyticus]MEB8339822.1 iron-siderophore ABC transporter substrate-binding protein [Streptomyces endophyticus]